MIRQIVRTIRRAVWPNKYDRWHLNCRRFDSYLERTTQVEANPFFVKVGANDGVSGDPCGRLFLDNLKWHGLLIEPVPYLFQKLSANYSDKNRFKLEQVAIGAQSGKTSFYYVDQKAKDMLPDVPMHYDMLGSFSREHIVNHLDGVLVPFIVAEELEVQRLTEVLERNHVQKITLLQIDTEGYDWEVLKSLDFSRFHISGVYIEHKHLSTVDRASMVALLESQGFNVWDCGNDFFAELRSGK